MDELDFVRQQLIAARDYTLKLLDLTPTELWFTIPPGAGTHIAWQVGHLVMAEFRLCIFFVRPIEHSDEAVVSEAFMAPFRRGTRAVADASAYPSAARLRSGLEAIHKHVLDGWPRYHSLDMTARISDHLHPVVGTRMDALTWMARHEMIHAGQIGLIRRMLGCPSMW